MSETTILSEEEKVDFHKMLEAGSKLATVGPGRMFDDEQVETWRTVNHTLGQYAANDRQRRFFNKCFALAIENNMEGSKPKSKSTVRMIVAGKGYPNCYVNYEKYKESIPYWKNKIQAEMVKIINHKE
jgi:hypothetical protein